ncbi:autotransporter outer membrane beta-barrel domain-containing protein [Sinorhizobium meliloti]|uniref:hypothetical protein n=1 Tax=Rhizobium meliloti TaxID=382 RepID=UPI000FDC6A2B|nr:hypothetical protein [Sinorhizobium meliloti]RVH21445.1 hypothetical protein CN216_00285 [Sinorhizobium meliloti]RVH21506.1 hypothetical protein CN216_00605 [Sinorhizobium meliloti]
MSFTPDTLSVIVQPIGGDGIRFVSYRTDDPVESVTGAGYFVGARKFGIRNHDLVFVSPVDGSGDPYILVIEIGPDGDGTGIIESGLVDAATAEQGAKADTALQPSDIGSDVQAYSSNLDVIASSSVAPAFDANVTVTVGTGGNFSTINAALAALSLIYGPRYKKGGVSATISLLSGFVMAEQVVVDKIDLSWITIDAVDPVVTISRAALTEAQYSLYYPAFTASRGARLPIISCLFEMDASGAVSEMKNGIFIVDGSWGRVDPGAGVRNAGGRGLHVANCSSCVARQSNFSGAGECAVRNSNSQVEVRESNLQNSGIGIKLAGAGITDAEDANVSGSTLGIENYESTLRFGNGIANNCGTGAYIEGGHVEADFASFDGATVQGVEVRLGSRVNLRSASIDTCGGIALLVSSATVSAPNLSAINAVSHAVYGVNGANIDVNTAVLTGAGAASYGVLAQQGAMINAQGADTTGAGAAGYRAQDGSIINARGATGTVDSTNVPNVVNGNGVVFTGDSPPFTTGPTTFAPATDNTHDIGTTTNRVRRAHIVDLRLGSNGDRRGLSSTGSPEGAITAPVGSFYLRQDGIAGSVHYAKESGAGSTGWGATPSYRSGTATYDPPSLVDGDGASTTVTVTGAALGDVALASFSLSTQGITVTAAVTAANTVTVRFQNETGGTIDLASGTLKAVVLKTG